MDILRKVLAVASLLIALVGLMPLVPLTFGFKSAVITNASAGTFYPTTNLPSSDTPFISCTQYTTTLQMIKNTTTPSSRRFFLCTNNWGSNVTIQWSHVSGSNVTAVSGSATVPAGGVNTCVAALFTTGASATGTTNVYQGVIDQSDLYAVIQFSGSVTTKTSWSTGC